jgi:hypothetical protein
MPDNRIEKYQSVYDAKEASTGWDEPMSGDPELYADGDELVGELEKRGWVYKPEAGPDLTSDELLRYSVMLADTLRTANPKGSLYRLYRETWTKIQPFINWED